MPTETTLAASLVAALLAPVLFIAATLTAITNLFDPTQPARPAATGPSTPDTRPCAPTTAPGAGAVGVPGFQADQIANAATIVAVGKQLGVPPHGWVIAVTAALAESGLRNLDHGDHDSLGLFQQRPSQGWGRPDQIRDPTYSATQFYRHLLALPGWQHMSVNDAAQAVQRSATPNTYAPHEHDAHTLINATGNTTCTPTSSTTTGGTRTAAGDSSATATGPSQAAAVAVAFARSQIGTPYRWGGNGATNDGWDCSGLTTAPTPPPESPSPEQHKPNTTPARNYPPQPPRNPETYSSTAPGPQISPTSESPPHPPP